MKNPFALLLLPRYIHTMNRQNLPYKLKVNHMTDYSDAEIKRMRGYRHTPDAPRGELFVSNTKLEDIPDYYNWRIRGTYVCTYIALSLVLKNDKCL